MTPDTHDGEADIDSIIAMLPPFAQHMGMTVSGLEDGLPVISYDFGRGVTGRPGYLHGGALSGLLEIAAFSALRTRISQDGAKAVLKPVNITVDFMRGGRQHRTFALGKITRLGQRVANVESIAWQRDRRKIIAAARLNFLLKREG